MDLTIEQLNEKYGWPVEEHINALKSGGLHPIYNKHLPVCWLIQNVYGHVENETMSLGKARELTASIVEDHIKFLSQCPTK